ncbi:hypothetical protein D3C78_1507790 [compost metagenome]
MRKENLSAFEIKDALLECIESIKCEFEVNGVLYDGIVHMSLPDYNFLVSNESSKIAYVVDFRHIKSITFDN